MVVIFENNKVTLINVTTSRDILLEKYNVITFINKPLNTFYATKVLQYFNQHPERILQYYLK
jgi:hypothetical protein